jgi:hypothetical protein
VYQIGSALSSVSMAPLANACSSRRGAPTVFKSVWHVLDATLDQPGTAMQTLAGAKACMVSTQGGALCARGFVFYGMCCLYQIGSALFSVSMAPVVNACSSRRGAPTVFKSVWHVLDATFDQPGMTMQTRPRPGPKRARCRLRVERCVRVVLCFMEYAAYTRLVLRCPVSAWHPW